MNEWIFYRSYGALLKEINLQLVLLTSLSFLLKN